jgi:hypothetical membrane protein
LQKMAEFIGISRLRLGYIIPAVFWGTTVVCGVVLGEYNHFQRLVSELGARGTPTQPIFTIGLVLSALLSALFIASLAEQCKLERVSKVPVLALLTFTVSIGGAAVFPLPLRAHLYFGLPSVLLLLSPLLSLILWRGSARLVTIRPYAIIGLCVMSLGFFAFAPRFLADYAGLKQRLFHAGWSVWFFGLSRGFLGVVKPGGRLK